MADKQLTVAELMARAQKENPDAQPRRRRRRSLDEGGVSVAELTGSLKAVDARPAEVKHSSVPIDSDAESAKPAKPVKPAEPTKSEPKTVPETATTEKVKAEKAEADKNKADKNKAEKVKAEEAKIEKVKAEPVAPAQPKKTPQPEAPATREKKTSRPEPAKAEKTESATSTAQATPKAQDETLARSSFKAVVPQPSKTEETGPISRVVTFGDRQAKDSEGRGGEPVEERGGVDKPASATRDPRAESDTEITQESPVVLDEHLPEEPVYHGEEQGEIEVDNSVNPIMLVLLVFAGLVVGVLMFLGFQYLWASLNPFLVGVLALAVTGGIVLLVRAMKTGRDGVTMTLAALAGAAMTFGPALVTAF